MSDSFLEEQVKRIRELTERMSRVQYQRGRAEAAIAYERQHAGFSPLHDVRDVRIVNTPMSDRAHEIPSRTRRRRRR